MASAPEIVVRVETDSSTQGEWAPSVFYWNNKYYFTVEDDPADGDPDGDVWQERAFVSDSLSPNCFNNSAECSNSPILVTEDACGFARVIQGRLYFYYSHKWDDSDTTGRWDVRVRESVGLDNSTPIVTNENPPDGATNQPSSPVLSVDVKDLEGYSMNIFFSTNASGSWTNIGAFTSVSDGTYTCTNTSSMSSSDTTYCWGVSVTDGSSWTNNTYQFTTQHLYQRVSPGIWWNTGWSYRKAITIDHSEVYSPLTDFPVLLDITDADLATKAQTNGNDIVFTDYYGQKLNHEIELYQNSTGHLIAWVCVPSLSSTQDTVLYMYYGNPTCGSQQNSSGVWDSSFAMVQHLNEASGTCYDSTSNHNDGTPYGGVTQDVTGQIDGAVEFDGSTGFIQVPDSDSLTPGTQVTLSAWVDLSAYATGGGSYVLGQVVGKWNQSIDDEYLLDVNQVGQLAFAWHTTGSNSWGDPSYNIEESAGSVGLSVWTYIVAIRNNTDVQFYINGELDSQYTGVVDSNPFRNGNAPVKMGAETSTVGRYLDGSIDEVIISNAARSSGWIETSYLNQYDPSTFYNVGPEETGIYTLSVQVSGQGSVTLNNTGPYYYYGDVVQLTAVPNVGWSFAGWSGSLTGSANPATLTMTSNMSVTAVFTQNQYTLTVNVVGSGSVSESPSQATYTWGTDVTMTANANAGWTFIGWSGDVSGTLNQIIVNMTGNMSVTATFTQNQYTLTVNAVGNGSVTLNNTGPYYYYGTVVQLTAVPSLGFGLQGWSGNLTGTANPATLTITGNMTVTATFIQVVLVAISPSLTNMTPANIGTTFRVNVTIAGVVNLQGFDFNVTWDNALLTLKSVDFTATLNNVWGSGNWQCAVNESGSGYYKLVALSTKGSFGSTQPTSLCMLLFTVQDPQSNSARQTPIHFDTVKLSDPQGNSITQAAADGTYSIAGWTPTLQMSPTSQTCRMYGENFTTQLGVTDALSLTDFKFEVCYNTTLLTYASITWNAWGSGTVTVDKVNGIITGTTSGTAVSDNQTLVTIQFTATYHHIWMNESHVLGWQNNQSALIYVQWANMSYATGPDLSYVRGGTQNQISVSPDFNYTFSPIQGDVDNNGVVNVLDMRDVANYFDVKQGDPLWSLASVYDLNGDGVIDIFDLVLIGVNFGYIY
jgi:uncharacterized repeat protein (TIGR02543 family)